MNRFPCPTGSHAIPDPTLIFHLTAPRQTAPAFFGRTSVTPSWLKPAFNSSHTTSFVRCSRHMHHVSGHGHDNIIALHPPKAISRLQLLAPCSSRPVAPEPLAIQTRRCDAPPFLFAFAVEMHTSKTTLNSGATHAIILCHTNHRG